MTDTANFDQMLAKIETGAGFIAALDQSGGSTPKALKGYGIDDGAWGSDEEMFALIHGMRSRIVTSPCFNGEKVIGAILFERTMDGEAGGKSVPALLWERGVVPFLKVDKGLEDEADGVQMMKPIGGLGELLTRAKAKGVFGTKMRSVINSASETGIAAIVKQQFEVAGEILDHGLIPIIEPEVNIKSETRAQCDEILLAETRKALDALPEGRRVMLKLSLPAKAGLFADLVSHPAVIRVVALSGGFSRTEACTELAKNNGIIASFSRALLNDLKHQMSDDEFDASLGGAIDEIHQASIA
ncbi:MULTISPECIES: fructose bisphosphate aldolase [Blastomonas]|jgi:fructose-bisphosphate aldolase class I|uniref:fructose-bisphosphate aldolase n=1 Tax=Blastomonas fulva TaxID=1550728 RepID=A0ABM6M8N3_9SPHN|nr:MULTISPECIES: fructose bisphosphate aldolase [Blastomonas]AOG00720.1 fructose-bisphosphate aldolase class-I family protein [Blastomonas sp. RAC04]ASR52341.1 fructose bisphosphate aldolase [Blastomonas fulva]MCO5793783.1 fructose bisphosphate aldolase [Blastomonas sp.]MDK2755184.1 fructose bisphosphate aldolase [Blastomonas fulva]MDM7929454.1 fructose bisphosphate aldolase [Blastomonas fulva]